MEKEFIPLEEALVLREFGLDAPSFGFYIIKDNSIYHREGELVIKVIEGQKGNICLAPTFQQAFKWFREVHKEFGCVDSNGNIIEVRLNGVPEDSYSSWEEAELECLRKLIEIVQNKKEKDEKKM